MGYAIPGQSASVAVPPPHREKCARGRHLAERRPAGNVFDLAIPVEDLPFKYDGILFGVHELPVTWTAD